MNKVFGAKNKKKGRITTAGQFLLDCEKLNSFTVTQKSSIGHRALPLFDL
jgi:hypothetical protein